MRFSLRALIGLVTLGCLALGTAIALAPRGGNILELTACVLGIIMAVESTLAIYAACDPWLGTPRLLDERRSAAASRPIRTGLATRILAVLTGILFTLLGGFVAAVLVEDNLTMDTGGASSEEWLLGLPFIASTMIGSFARGAGVVGFLALLCGVPLGRHFGKMFGLCCGSIIALLLWAPMHEVGKPWAAGEYGMSNAYGNLASGSLGLSLLVACTVFASWYVGRDKCFGRRARRRAARLFLVGLLLGAVGGFLLSLRWLAFRDPTTAPFFGAFFGSHLAGLLGLLTGASAHPYSLQASSRHSGRASKAS